MENNEIIEALWKRDLDDPRVLDGLYSMAYNTSDTALAVTVYQKFQEQM